MPTNGRLCKITFIKTILSYQNLCYQGKFASECKQRKSNRKISCFKKIFFRIQVFLFGNMSYWNFEMCISPVLIFFSQTKYVTFLIDRSLSINLSLNFLMNIFYNIGNIIANSEKIFKKCCEIQYQVVHTYFAITIKLQTKFIA